MGLSRARAMVAVLGRGSGSGDGGGGGGRGRCFAARCCCEVAGGWLQIWMPAHACRDCGVVICRLGIAVWMKAKVDKKQSARVQLRCRGKARCCRLRWRCLLACSSRAAHATRTNERSQRRGILLPACPATTTILMRSLLSLTHSLLTLPLQRPLFPVQLLHSHTHAADDEHDVAARPRPG